MSGEVLIGSHAECSGCHLLTQGATNGFCRSDITCCLTYQYFLAQYLYSFAYSQKYDNTVTRMWTQLDGGEIMLSIEAHPVVQVAKHDILGTNGGTSRLDMGQLSIDPSTKLEGSFLSIHRPSNCTLEWN